MYSQSAQLQLLEALASFYLEQCLAGGGISKSLLGAFQVLQDKAYFDLAYLSILLLLGCAVPSSEICNRVLPSPVPDGTHASRKGKRPGVCQRSG